MKRVLVLAKAYAPHLGGVETIVRSIAEGAIARGFRTTVLCFGSGPAEEFLCGVRVRRVRPQLSLGSAPLSTVYFQAFSELAAEADLVHIHSPNPAGELAWLLASRRIRDLLPSICTYHGDPVRPRVLAGGYLALLRRFLPRCSRVVVSTPRLLASSRAIGCVRERCTVVHLGVKTRRFPNSEGDRANPFSQGLGRPLGVFAGRLVYYKGVEVLLRAAALAPGVSLLLVGEGPLRSSLERLAADLGVSDRVRFAPPVDDQSYPDIFRGADFFVLPSVSPSEAFGLSLAEAMASGLPAISTELGTGTSYVNLHGETGLVVPPGDTKALAEAMRTLRDDPELAAKMGANGARRAREFFDEESMIDEYCHMYEKLPKL